MKKPNKIPDKKPDPKNLRRREDVKSKKEIKIEKKKFPDFSNWKHILGITLIVSISLVGAGFFSGNSGVLGTLIIISVFINITPIILTIYQKYRQVKEMEEKFPDFLRDLTESIRSGMPFHKAIVEANRNDYGAFSPEVKKMMHQLSWGVPLDRVLDKLSERVKISKRLFLSIKIIRESFVSGGEVVSTLESVADSVTNLEETEKEKQAILSQYVLLMYAISIIFVVIIASINKFLIPVFQSGEDTPAGGSLNSIVQLENPCNNCLGFECNVCDTYNGVYRCLLAPSDQLEPNGICQLKDPSTLTDITVYYTSLFFLMALVQSIFSGLVAGQMSEGSIRAGIKHSIILAGITVGSFLIMIQFGFLGI